MMGKSGSIYKSIIYALIFFSLLTYVRFCRDDMSTEYLTGGDGLCISIPSLENSSTFKLWSPYNACGHPSYSSPQSMYFYPLTFVCNILPQYWNFNIFLLMHFVLAGIFMFLYLKSLKINDLAALAGGSVLILSSNGEIGFISTFAWAMFLFMCVEQFWQTGKRIYLLLISLGVYCIITAGFPPLMFMLFVLLSCYIIFSVFLRGEESLKQNIFKGIKIVLMFAIGIGMSAILLVPMMKVVGESVRTQLTYNFFVSQSVPPFFIVSLLFPKLFNSNLIGIGPWDIYFVGIVGFTMVLSALCIWKHENKIIWFWTIIGVIAIFLTFGRFNPLYKIMYYLPGFNSFRIPSRYNAAWFLSASVLISFAWHYFFSEEKQNDLVYSKAKKLGKLWLIIAAVSVFLFYSIRKYYIIAYPHLMERSNIMDNLWLRSGNMIASVCFLVIMGIFLCWFARLKKVKAIQFVLLVMLISEFFAYGQHKTVHDWSKNSQIYHNDTPFDKVFAEEKSSDNYRVFDFSSWQPANINVMSKNLSANLYDPLIPGEYKSLVHNTTRDTKDKHELLIINNKLLSALSVKYVTVETPFIVRMMDNLGVPNENKSEPINLGEMEAIGEKNWKKDFTVKVVPGTNYMFTFSASYNNLPESEVIIIAEDYKIEIQPTTFKKDITQFEYLLNFPASKDKTKNKEVDSKITLSTNNKYPIKFTDMVLKPWSSKSADKHGKIYERVAERNNQVMFRNTQYLPRIFFARKLLPVKNIEEARKYFFEDSIFDPEEVSLIENPADEIMNVDLDNNAVVSEVQYDNDLVRLKLESSGPALFILNDRFDSDWQAKINGAEANIYRINGFARGLFLPSSGAYNVEFEYNPTAIWQGLYASLISAVLLVVVLLVDYIISRRKTSIAS